MSGWKKKEEEEEEKEGRGCVCGARLKILFFSNMAEGTGRRKRRRSKETQASPFFHCQSP